MLKSVVLKSSILLILSCLTYAQKEQPYFHDFPDDGTREVAYAAEAWLEHGLKSMDYNMNIAIPGFIRKSETNQRLYNQPDGKHLVVAKMSYKWIEGPPVETGRMLDFCVNGYNKGFFTFQITNNLIAFSRDGRFRINKDNILVSLSGNFPVLGEDGFIYIPPKSDVTVSRTGNVFAGTDLVGKFKITVFESFSEMDKYLHNLSATFFTLDQPIGILEGEDKYNILQGHVSQSNVFRAYDGWYYRTAHKATLNGLDMLINGRRTLFNALP